MQALQIAPPAVPLGQTMIRSQTISRLLGWDSWLPLALAAALGTAIGVAALGFILPIRAALNWLSGPIPGHLGLWVLAMPIAGAILAGVVARLMPTNFRGHGVSRVLLAVHRDQGQMRIGIGIRQWLRATFTIASGGSAGPEGPIVTIGASIGAALAAWLGAGTQLRTTLLGCGAAAGLAAVFNAPLAGVFFVLEVILRDFTLRTFAPIVVASVMGATTAQAILGSNEPLFGIAPEAFAGEIISLGHLPWMCAVAILIGLAAGWFGRFCDWSQTQFERIRTSPLLVPVIGAGLLVLMGLAWAASRGDRGLPPFYGDGYPQVVALLEQPPVGSTLAALGLLLLAFVVKSVATVCTVSSGGAGGMFAPTLLLGAILGAACGVALQSVGIAVSPMHTAAIGMGAFVAGTAMAPLTGALLVYEVTGLDSIMLPSVAAAAIAVTAAKLVNRESIYEGELRHYGIRLGVVSDSVLLRRQTIRDIGHTPAVAVRLNAPAMELKSLAATSETADIIAIDEANRPAGVVAAADLRSALLNQSALAIMHVHDLARPELPTLRPTDTLAEALERFSTADLDTLPVVGADGELLGVLTRTRMLLAYHRLLDTPA